MKRLIPLMVIMTLMLAGLACSISVDLGGEPSTAVSVRPPTAEEKAARDLFLGVIAGGLVFTSGVVAFTLKVGRPGGELYEGVYFLMLLAGVGSMAVGIVLQNPLLALGGMGVILIGTPVWALFGDGLTRR